MPHEEPGVGVVAGCDLNENLRILSVLYQSGDRAVTRCGGIYSITMAVIVWSDMLFWGCDCYSYI